MLYVLLVHTFIYLLPNKSRQKWRLIWQQMLHLWHFDTEYENIAFIGCSQLGGDNTLYVLQQHKGRTHDSNTW
jgi:hypothetical protein